jgi:AcrR family transcriptional regulator
MAAVARRAEVSKGLIYNYFASKEVLLREILMEGLAELEAIPELFPDGVQTVAHLEELIDFYVQRVASRGAYWKLYFSLTLQIDVLALLDRALVEHLMVSVMGRVARFFELRGSAEPVNEALLLSHTLDGVFMNYLANPDYTDLEVMKRLLVARYS